MSFGVCMSDRVRENMCVSSVRSRRKDVMRQRDVKNKARTPWTDMPVEAGTQLSVETHATLHVACVTIKSV